jgi:hypothetical protein
MLPSSVKHSLSILPVPDVITAANANLIQQKSAAMAAPPGDVPVLYSVILWSALRSPEEWSDAAS